MRIRPKHFVWGVVAVAVLIAPNRVVRAQTASAASSSAAVNGMGMGMGTGMGMMPMMYAMNPTASLSPTDAAALGMQGQSNGGTGVNGVNAAFRNPMAAPYLFGSVYPMSPSQTGMLMLANQAGRTGIGSGQLSGVRPGPGQSRGRSTQPAAKSRGTTSNPGGLAARYFNRNSHPVAIPRSYYARESRYYPQLAR